ncbi:MAG: hypothetical protein M3066_02145 [Actinomycetota bacterium]|nr:hypothetical protein [Actinomycetota bacterium]
MGRGWRILAVLAVTMVLGTVLRAVGVGLILPLVLPVPSLAMAYFSMKARQPPTCPTCGLRLSYRKLGPNHGMLECPAMCGYRRLVGDPRARP